MPAVPFILFPRNEPGAAWRVSRLAPEGPSFTDVAIPEDSTAEQTADAIAGAMSTLGHAGQAVVLAVPSAWCMAASISTADLPKQDRKALVFRFEEKLPLPVENVVADFVPSDAGALGVCVRLDQVKPLVDALEARHAPVQSVTPALLLAAQDLRASQKGMAAAPAQLLVIGEDGYANLLAILDGKLGAWSFVPATPPALKLQRDLLAMEFEQPPQVILCDPLGDNEVPMMLPAATRAGARVLAGKDRPWIEFRRDALAIGDRLRLHRRAIDSALAAAAVFLLAVAGALFARGVRYDHVARDNERRLAADFALAFPGWSRPADVKAVVEAEHRRVAGRAPESLPPEARASALRVMGDVLGRFPENVRFTLERMTFNDNSFEFDARLRSFEDADAMAQAARAAGMDVPPPQTRKEASGFWSVTLRGATPKPPAPRQSAGADGVAQP